MTKVPAGRVHRSPAVSVVMPVRNAMPFLDQAIQSILAQTLTDFELIIGDDASDDGSSERIAFWAKQDRRIRALRRDQPSGPAAASNWVADHAQSEFVARMDADDISHPERLARQLAAMDAHPDAVLVGSIWHGIDETNRIIRPPDLAGLLRPHPFARPFAHGTVMVRRSAFRAAGGYRTACEFWEDTDLFVRLREAGKILILTEPMYSYRFARVSNRLHANRTQLEMQLALQLRCKAAFAVQGHYESEFAIDRDGIAPLPLRVLQQRAALAVWAGQPSIMLREFLVRRRKEPIAADLPSLVFLCLAQISPRIFRRVLAGFVSIRNLVTKRRLAGAKFVQWPASGNSKCEPGETRTPAYPEAG